MIRINNLTLPPDADFSDLRGPAASVLGCRPGDIKSCRLWRRSLDARRGLRYVCSVVLELSVPEADYVGGNVDYFDPAPYPLPPSAPRTARVIVAGFGPAGIFCAYTLARAGFRPIVLERGEDADTRAEAVRRFWRDGELDTECNVQFGEGGAGAFSDGKLSTGVKDPRCRHVLETLCEFGAPGEILTDAHPHIGTDRLRGVISAIRAEIIRLGGEVLFGTRLERVLLHRGAPDKALVTSRGIRRELACDAVVLALGHSARDTARGLHADGFLFTQKAFSMGARIEHHQREIDFAQYGGHPDGAPPAEYRLSRHLPGGRSAYTFCMCPGGVVVGAASQAGGVVTNGMSMHARDGRNANSALLVGVNPSDFPSPHPLSGIDFQEKWERAAYTLGGGTYRAPAQLVGDFLENRPSRRFGAVTPTCLPGVVPCDIRACLPDFVTEGMKAALPLFDRMLKGFASPDAVLTAPETRSSSPCRMQRGEDMTAVGRPGVYPCGEGAGYAGGIMSAAADGIRVAEQICRRYG